MANVKARQPGGNMDVTAFGRFVMFGLDEINLKGKAEQKSSYAYGFALIAMRDDRDTREKVMPLLNSIEHGDDKTKPIARDKLADMLGAFDEKNKLVTRDGDKLIRSQDFRNYMNRQIARLTFASDMIGKGWHEQIVLEEHNNGTTLTATIKGETALQTMVRKARKWDTGDSPISAIHTIRVEARAQQASRGVASWAQLVDAVARECGHMGGGAGRVVPITISKSQPLQAVTRVGELLKEPELSAHFGNAAAALEAVRTAENMVALVFGNARFANYKARKVIEDAMETFIEFLASEAGVDKRKAELAASEQVTEPAKAA